MAALYPQTSKLADGKLSKLKDVALTLLHQEPDPEVFLTLDDESKIKVKTMLVVISNAPMFGANFLVAPDASVTDGFLDISVYPDFSKTEVLAYYAQVRSEGFSANEKVQRYRASKVEIKTNPKMKVMADGVMLGKGKVKIKSKPRRRLDDHAGRSCGAPGAREGRQPRSCLLRACPGSRAGALHHKGNKLWQNKQVTNPLRIQRMQPSKLPKQRLPPVQRGDYRTYLFQIGLLAVIGAFTTLTILVKTNPSFPIDLAITQALQSIDSPIFAALMSLISWPGFSPQSFLIPLLIAGILYAFGFQWEAVVALFAALLAPLLNVIVKDYIRRPRPGIDLVHVLKVLDSYSFPSGHVMFYVCFFGFLWFLAYTLLKRSWILYFAAHSARKPDCACGHLAGLSGTALAQRRAGGVPARKPVSGGDDCVLSLGEETLFCTPACGS